MTGFVDTRILVRTAGSQAYEGDCAVLAQLAPPNDYMLFPKQWDCGPATFDFLVDSLLEGQGMADSEREWMLKRVIDGKAVLLYRGASVERDETVPEGRLWPF